MTPDPLDQVNHVHIIHCPCTVTILPEVPCNTYADKAEAMMVAGGGICDRCNGAIVAGTVVDTKEGPDGTAYLLKATRMIDGGSIPKEEDPLTQLLDRIFRL